MADRELEINNYKDKVEWLENSVTQLKKQLAQNEVFYKEEIKKLSSQKSNENNLQKTNTQKEGQSSTDGETTKNECKSVSSVCAVNLYLK